MSPRPVGGAALLFCFTCAAQAYSVLSHEAIVDAAWEDSIKPILLQRFPGATPEDLLKAHAYVYGGSIIQDMGYYPFGSHLFSDLTHYIHSGDFIVNMLAQSQDLNEYAFAMGAMAVMSPFSVGVPVLSLHGFDGGSSTKGTCSEYRHFERSVIWRDTELFCRAAERAHSHRACANRVPWRLMQLTIRLLRETDGRWIGDVPELPGVSVYGTTREEAMVRAKALALRVVAEEIEHGEMNAAADLLQFSPAA
jgi:predicted RNase H-like HicB family nuclease